MGWANLGNGRLLAVASSRFDAFITVDANIQYQQNLSKLPLAVLVMVAADNELDTLKPCAPWVLEALSKFAGKVLLCIHGDGRIELMAKKN